MDYDDAYAMDRETFMDKFKTYETDRKNNKVNKDRFIEGLKEQYNLNYAKIIKQGWKYAGGDYKHHRNYFRLCFPKHDFPPLVPYCLCGKTITRNGYICGGNEDEFIITGCCCIKKFIGGRTCGTCSKPHRRSKTNTCFDCEKIEKDAEKLRKKYEGGMKCLDCDKKIETSKWKKQCGRCYYQENSYKM